LPVTASEESIVTKQNRITTRLFRPFALFLLSFQPILSFAQRGALLDQGGASFNVKAYGATGDGTADDTSAIQSAIDAATKAHGGVVYFPPGSYVLNGTLHNDRADMVSLVGSGMASRLLIKSKLGISLASTGPHSGDSGYHSGRIQSLYIRCTEGANETAIQMTDMIGPPSLNDLSISHCDQGFDIINRVHWTERLMATNITDNYNNHLFHYDQNPKNTNASYGYGTYDGIYTNKAPGQDIFYLTGGAYLYHSSFTVKGNLDGDAKNAASIFHIHGALTEPCPGAAYNLMDISVEGDHYSVVKVTNSGCTGGAAGNPLVTGIGFISASGGTSGDNNYISDPQAASHLVAIFTATNSSSDSVKANNATPGTKCYVQPTNAIAANAIVGTYVSGTNWQTVTVTHPPTANKGQYQIWCTP
jgi:Pectate lyase superfamily protein